MTHVFVICRLQGFHYGHRQLIDAAIHNHDKVTVIIGSSNKARSIKNPWTFEERAGLLSELYPQVNIDGIQDFDYNDELWEAHLHEIITRSCEEGESPVIMTSSKDNDGELRVAWARDIQVEAIAPITDVEGKDFSATRVREALLVSDRETLSHMCDMVTYDALTDEDSPMYAGIKAMKAKRRAILNQQHAWRGTPYPVIMPATDCLIFDSEGNVALIQRGGEVGHGLWALPGGFLEKNLTEYQNNLKEVHEETGLQLDDMPAESRLITSMRFDALERSELDRITTTLFVYAINAEKPELVAGDDAMDAKWYNPTEILDMYLFDDHCGMIVEAMATISKSGLLLQ